jgi:hypothetical protein
MSEARFFYGVVKLLNGDTLLSTVYENTADGVEELQLHYPTRVFEVPMMTDSGGVVERFLLQDYLPFSEFKIINVHIANTLFISPLSEIYAKKYVEFVHTLIAGSDENLSKEFSSYISDLEEEEEDLQLEEEESLSEEESSPQQKKRWLH